ncbi:hypothetical protein ADK77_08455 [Streptomyces antibioticus]|nr:hypothetical protein [Streptomyces antibioticus]KOG73549.1 hypothetical protein ADK77_08455 [Streptomyces antibioticus]
MTRNENMIAALKRERAIYVNAGDEDRIRQVDESLAHYGYDVAGDAEQDGPQGRSSAPQQTADQGNSPAKKTAAKKTTAATPPSA